MRRIGSILVCIAISLTTATEAQAVNPDASIVRLEKDCTSTPDCFETTGDLTDWLWGTGGRTQAPSAGDPVSVQVGPGDFNRFECDGTTTATGYVSVVGAGREQTRFVNTAEDLHPSGYCMAGVTVTNCEELNFQDLTAFGHRAGAFWVGGGSSTWSNVDMIAQGAQSSCGIGRWATLGWYDLVGVGGTSVHYFFGSRAIARGGAGVLTNLGFDTTDAENWFYGGDILAESTVDAPIYGNYGILVASTAGMHVFGTSVRSRAGAAINTTFPDGGFLGLGHGLVGVSTNGAGVFHMHGGIIHVNAGDSTANVSPIGIRGAGHTPGTAFVMKATGTGQSERLRGPAQSPFLWPAASTPPDIDSENGQDLFVDTDAGSVGGESHLMVYDEGCTGAGGTWRDMTNGACR